MKINIHETLMNLNRGRITVDQAHDEIESAMCEADACAQLSDVRARIECMMLVTDCALDDTEQRRINRSFSNGYNKAIRDILGMMSEHFI